MRTSRGRDVRGRVERMERTGSGEQEQDAAAALPSGREREEERGTRAGAGPLASFAYTAADEEKQRGVRRMKLTATGLLLLVAIVYVLATWAKNSGVGAGRATLRRLPRRGWWARWRTGSP